MKVLFIISSSESAFWLSEVTHPYWHLREQDHTPKRLIDPDRL